MPPFDAAPRACSSKCTVCPTASACIIHQLLHDDLGRWEASVESQVSLPEAGKALVEAGDAASAIYTVRAGCLKGFTMDDEGHERVRAFYLPGDFVGLDALGGGVHPATVVAVAPSQLCRVPLSALQRALGERPALAQALVERISRELDQALARGGDYTAEQRLAAFLLSMQRRLGDRGSLRLPMTRRDIANYLRLATETVCRVLGRFEKDGRIESDSKTVRVVDPRALRTLALPLAA